MVEKAQLGRSYEHGEEPIGERRKRQKTKDYPNRRGLFTGLHGLVRRGRSYLTKIGIGVLGEQAIGSLNGQIEECKYSGRHVGWQSGKTRGASHIFPQAIDKRAGVNGGPRIVCRGERKGWEVEPTYHSH